jgi:multicomponent K+:H+ antiporter subunit D
MARAGAQVFWRRPPGAAEAAPRPLRVAEWAPVAMLLALCVMMSVFAAPALRYAGDAAAQLADAEAYRAAVLEARSRVRSNEVEVAR